MLLLLHKLLKYFLDLLYITHRASIVECSVHKNNFTRMPVCIYFIFVAIVLRVYVTHLALYNLIMNGCGGRRGFYNWNEDICGFIHSNWNALMPHRKKTQSWHSTVAGTLSPLPLSLVRCGIFCFQCMTPIFFSCLCVIWQLVEYVGISYYVNDSLRMEV